ncbi:hypothetical protein ACUN9Y_19645 [Halomonas sp. V046]|uniref:hypothetical protein n=1 Tax=Halomonas sp. V046 TaxID=3459611 RepID=UPI00404464DF
MTSDEFVNAFKVAVKDAAIKDSIAVLQSPPGRKPAKEIVEASHFYNNLDDEGRQMVDLIIKHVAEGASFGALCVLDGVRAIESGAEKGEIILNYKKNGATTNINKNNDLHDIYNSK